MSSDERVKLRTLLNYWLEHNKEHASEFREWAEMAKAFGETEAGEDVLEAAQRMDKANEPLSQALRRLEEKER